MGQLEGDRDDAPNAQFFGMRATWKPHPRVEIGLSRSAQWCGDGRPCDLDTFWDLLIGNDNDQPLEEQPGNQIGGLRRALVASLGAGRRLRARRSARTRRVSCRASTSGSSASRSGAASATAPGARTSSTPTRPAASTRASRNFGCAYRNVIYLDGYQYHDRSIGHAIDGDSRQLAAGAMLIDGDGSSWELAVQDARVNRKDANEVHSVSLVRDELRSMDLHHRRELFGGDLRVGIGYEERDLEQPGDQDRLQGIPAMVWSILKAAWRHAAAMGLALACLGFLAPSAEAQTPTSAQIEAFMSLPPEQQEQLMRQFGISPGSITLPQPTAPTTTSTTTLPGEGTVPVTLPLPEEEMIDEEPRLEPAARYSWTSTKAWA